MPASRASALARKPPFVILLRLPAILAPSKPYSPGLSTFSGCDLSHSDSSFLKMGIKIHLYRCRRISGIIFLLRDDYIVLRISDCIVIISAPALVGAVLKQSCYTNERIALTIESVCQRTITVAFLSNVCWRVSLAPRVNSNDGFSHSNRFIYFIFHPIAICPIHAGKHECNLGRAYFIGYQVSICEFVIGVPAGKEVFRRRGIIVIRKIFGIIEEIDESVVVLAIFPCMADKESVIV